MLKGIIDCNNMVDFDVDLEFLERLISYHGDFSLELVLCDSDYIFELNEIHRGKKNSTDVLSFPLKNISHSPIGLIVINIDDVRENSALYGHKQSDELALLFIHGLLHVLGFDHENDKGEMRDMEKGMIEYFDLPESLIIRSED